MGSALRTLQERNMLTFDIEDWYHANYDGVNLAAYRGKGSNFRANVDLLLQLCND